MAKDWDYANLAHTAKEFGGPEKYLQIVKDHSFQEGRKDQLIIDGAIVIGAGCLYLGTKAYNHFKKKRVTVEQAEEAEEILVEKMNEVLYEELEVTPEFEG